MILLRTASLLIAILLVVIPQVFCEKKHDSLQDRIVNYLADLMQTHVEEPMQDQMDSVRVGLSSIFNQTQMKYEKELASLNSEQLDEYKKVYNQWLSFGKALQSLSNAFVQQITSSIFANGRLDYADLNPKCTLALLKGFKDMRNQKRWIMKMIDASSKPSINGFLEGTVTDLGSFDQCLDVNSFIEYGGKQEKFFGQYCLFKASILLPPKPEKLYVNTRLFNFENTSLQDSSLQEIADFAHALYDHDIRLALCVPSVCSVDDLNLLVKTNMPNNTGFSGRISSCQVRSYPIQQTNFLSKLYPMNISDVQIVILIVYALLIWITFLGTLIDVLFDKQRRSHIRARETLKQQFSLNCYPVWQRRSLEQATLKQRTSISSNPLDINNASCNSVPPYHPPPPPSQPDVILREDVNPTAYHARFSLDADTKRRQFRMASRHSLRRQFSIAALQEEPPMGAVYFLGLQITAASKLGQTLLAFSLKANLDSLFGDQEPQPSMVKCVNGIRVISMFWIVLTHTYLLPIKSAMSNPRSFLRVSESAWFQLIINGWVLVDSFFFISAFLLTTNQLRLLRQTSGRINFVRIIIARLLRIAPSLWFILSFLFLLPLFAQGPLWFDYLGEQIESCKMNWWTNVLFYNNWMPHDRVCLLHTWYLSADLQMFAASLFLLIPLYKSPKLGITLVLVTLLAGVITTFANTFYNHLPPTVIYNSPNERIVKKITSQVYTVTFPHIGSYCVGMLVGYLYHIRPVFQPRGWINALCWFLALATSSFIIFSTQSWNLGYEWTNLQASLYASIHRVAWSSSLAWITYACATGNGYALNTFLSWKAFEPLAKLSYMIYLVHFVLLWMRLSYARNTLAFSHYTMICEFLVNLVVSVIFALVPYLLVEAPFAKLYRVYFSHCFECITTELKLIPKRNPKNKMDSVQFSSIKDFS